MKMFLMLIVCSFVFALNVVNSESKHDLVLKFGVNASDRSMETVRKFVPILKVLEQMLTKQYGNVKIAFRTFDYKGAINAIADGEVDFVRLGPASYVIAKKKNPGIKLLAMENKKGKRYFNGLIIVRPRSSIRTIEDLRGKRFAFGNKVSTIGRFLSQALLSQNGITSSDLSKFKYWRRHDSVFRYPLQIPR